MTPSTAADEHAARDERRFDLAEIAAGLRLRFRGNQPRGYLRGKTRIRDAVIDLCNVSEMKAEGLVDQMQARGFVRYGGDPRELDGGRAPWTIDVHPLCVS